MPYNKLGVPLGVPVLVPKPTVGFKPRFTDVEINFEAGNSLGSTDVMSRWQQGHGLFLLKSFQGTERLGELFTYELTLKSSLTSIDGQQVLGRAVKISIDLQRAEQAKVVVGGGSAKSAHTPKKRFFHGIITDFTARGEATKGEVIYVATVRPVQWLLNLSSDCRVYQDKTALAIIEEIFEEQHLPAVVKHLHGAHDTVLPYCVQYNESTWHFVSRLLEAEGIYYYFVHNATDCQLVLADHPLSHTVEAGYERVAYLGATAHRAANPEGLQSFARAAKLQTRTYQGQDFDFQRPNTPIFLQTTAAKPHAYDQGTVFQYPGDFKQTSASGLEQRLLALRSKAQFFAGTTNCPGIAVGRQFGLDPTGVPEAVLKDEEREQRYLTVELILQILGDSENASAVDNAMAPEPWWQAQFTALPQNCPYQPPPLALKPQILGAQTAIVVGDKVGEVFADNYGRVQVHFHWDHLVAKGQKAQDAQKYSCWLRVAQTWSGQGYGAFFLPRVGQEVLVTFLEGDPDKPLINGCLYNAENVSPYLQSRGFTESGIRTRSFPGGGAHQFNELKFADRLGEEEVYLQAQKDLVLLVKNDEKQQIAHDRQVQVKHNDHLQVGGNASTRVTGNAEVQIERNLQLTTHGHVDEFIQQGYQRTTIGLAGETVLGGISQLEVLGNRQVNIVGAHALNVLGREDTHVLLDRDVAVGLDLHVAVGNNMETLVGKDLKVTVEGQVEEHIKGQTTVKLEEDLVLVAGDCQILLQKNGAITLSGKSLRLSAEEDMNLDVQGSLLVKAQKINLN